MPTAPGDKSVSAPEVLPTAPGDPAEVDDPEVMPTVSFGLAKAGEAQVLPGEPTTFDPMIDDRSDRTSRTGDQAETLNPSDVSPDDEGFLVNLSNDEGVPQVLPAIDDGFVLTGKVADEPPVMPTMDDFDPLVLPGEFDPGQEFMMSLVLEGPQSLYDGNLTLIDEWSGSAPSRQNDWG